MTHHRIAIVGGGPAGIACAVQLNHAGLQPLLIERDQLGGLLSSANWVENYPGFPDGINGSDLANLFANHLSGFNPALLFAEVVMVKHNGKVFQLTLDKGELTADTLVIATGTVPKPLPDFCRKPELNGRIYREIIPLMGENGKTIAIIGGGDAAFDYALNLARANDVVILSRSTQPKCLPGLERIATDNPRIHYSPNSEILDIAINQDGKLQLVRDYPTEDALPGFDSILFAIGRMPNLDFISESVMKEKEQLEKKFLLFPIGDAINGHRRQTAIAVGQGVMAAMQIMENIKEA